MKSKEIILSSWWAALLMPISVQAHPFRLSGDTIGFFSGLVDPFASTDHILAMLAFGVWVYRVGRPLVYLLPIVFVGLMLMGGIFTLIPIEIAYADKALYLSVVLLGLMLVSDYKVPLPIATLIAGVFAFFHGYVHAFDMLLGIETIMYTTGFAIGALLLITTGLVIRLLLVRVSNNDLNRFFRWWR